MEDERVMIKITTSQRFAEEYEKGVLEAIGQSISRKELMKKFNNRGHNGVYFILLGEIIVEGFPKILDIYENWEGKRLFFRADEIKNLKEIVLQKGDTYFLHENGQLSLSS